MVTPFISSATATSAKATFQRAFETFKLLGDTVDLLLWRDTDTDGIGTQIGPVNVLMVPANTQASLQRGQATAFTGADGEFQKLAPFDVKAGDLFTIDGIHGEIKIVAPPDAINLIRAAYELKA